MQKEHSLTPYNATPYYCNICDVYCASPVNLQTHFLGMKHRAAEEALNSHDTVTSPSNTGEPTKPPDSLPEYIQTETPKMSGKTLEEQLNSCKDTQPAIGLQYITEYHSEGLPCYACNLCGCVAGLGIMFMHVLGAKHKLAYLKRHYPKLADIKGRVQNMNKKLKRIAAEIEKKEGRKKIMVAMDQSLGNDDKYTVQPTDSLVTWFSGDDGTEKKSAKEAEDTSKNADSKTQSDDDNKPGDKEQRDQNTRELKVVELDDSDSEDFSNNEDLLDYLQYFEIINEDDASFILEVTKKLTNSLVAYRQKISENKNFSELNSNEAVGDPSEYSTGTSARSAEPITDFMKEQPPVQLSSEDTGRKLKVKLPFKRKASQLSANVSTSTHKMGHFVPTFKEVPSEQIFCAAETQRPPSSKEHLSNPTSAKPESQVALTQDWTDRPSISLPGSSATSDNDVVAEFFTSIRNMDIDEVAATLHKIAASNSTFSGMDVQNVIKILTESGNLKPKKANSTRLK